MAAMLWWLTTLLDGWFSASVASRVAGVALLVGAGGLVYFGVLWAIGGFHVAHLAKLRRGAGTA
jgi:putative peptidoglycan lipid II flippase